MSFVICCVRVSPGKESVIVLGHYAPFTRSSGHFPADLTPRPPSLPARASLGKGENADARSLPLPLPCERSERIREGGRGVRYLAVLAVLACLPGCTTGRNAGAGGGPSGSGNSAATTAAGNTLRYPLTTEPTTLDPALVEDGTTIDLLQGVFEGLVKWNEKSEIAPNLAEKWELSPDGKTYTFHLKHGVKFHNGREMKADDFKYSIERACIPASPTAPSYLKDIVGATDHIAGKATDVSGIKVVAPYTLAITIDSFKPYWLGNMTYPCAYVVCREEIEKNGGKVDGNSLVGTGPFKLDKYAQGVSVSLLANPDYHNEKPKVSGIFRPILRDASTRLAQYQNDQLDYLEITPADLDHINSDPKLKPDLKAFPRAAVWYLAMNADAPDSPFKKIEVRKAFAMAIDKNEIIRVALKNQADLANGVLPPGVLGYNPNVKPLPFDPSQAKQLLAQAGYPDGKGFPTLTFTFRQDYPQVGKTAEVIAGQLKTNLNIDTQLQPLEWGQFLKERTRKSMPLAHLRWGADYLDAQNFLSTLLHTDRTVNGQRDHPENGVGYSNPEFDKLCDQADTEHDPAKRVLMYQQAEQIAVNEAPWVPLYFQRDLELVKPRVQHLRNSLFGHLPHVTTTVQ